MLSLALNVLRFPFDTSTLMKRIHCSLGETLTLYTPLNGRETLVEMPAHALSYPPARMGQAGMPTPLRGDGHSPRRGCRMPQGVPLLSPGQGVRLQSGQRLRPATDRNPSPASLGSTDNSQVNLLGVRYKFVKFVAETNPGQPDWCDRNN